MSINRPSGSTERIRKTLEKYQKLIEIENMNVGLVPAKWEDLKYAMEQDSELHDFLKTPAKDLFGYYKCLVNELFTDFDTISLLRIIGLALGKRQARYITSYFYKYDSKILGFAGYIIDNYEVVEIKTFSFYPLGDGVIGEGYFYKLLDELVSKYNKISWNAMEKNPANALYKKAIEKYNGTFKEGWGNLHYTIEK